MEIDCTNADFTYDKYSNFLSIIVIVKLKIIILKSYLKPQVKELCFMWNVMIIFVSFFIVNIIKKYQSWNGVIIALHTYSSGRKHPN